MILAILYSGGGTTKERASPKFCLVRHALDPVGGAYNSPPDSLAGFKGRLLHRGERGR